MKKILLSLALFMSITTFAQNEKYISAMKANIDAMKTAQSNDQLAALQAKFERIATAEKNQWLPYYYAASLKVRLSMQQAGNQDKLADEAEALMKVADSLQPKNSEIYCLKSMIATARLLVDPMSRWMQYGKESNDNIEAAKKADSTNPRPYVLQAVSTKNTPEQFGGGCKKAKPIAEKAVAKFATFKPTSELHPMWGKEMVDEIITTCAE
jgi:hypothetical protein